MRSEKLLMRLTTIVAAVAIAVAAVAAEQRAALRLLPDDPLMFDDDTVMDAGDAALRELGSWADFVRNTFMAPGDRRSIPAVNANTLGGVPDSSWFTNRLGARAMTLDEIARGPDRTDRLDARDWVIVAGKSTGHQAGFRAVSAEDPEQLYQIEFDSVSNPEMATGAEIIGTAIYHALGYHVVDVYLIEVDPARLTIAPSATIEDAGRERAFTRRDLDAVLGRAARLPSGRYRATASRFAEGRNLGPFRYDDTRPDDPNDIYPHEHRRELRGNRVFAAWLNHDDSRAGNSLDMLVGPPGRRYVKHYMFDFGSILGSGTSDPDHAWAGHEYVVERRPALLTLATFGLWRRPFIGVEAPDDLPAAGSFTADGFEPERWKPHFPNTAFMNMQPDDALWAAQILAAFPIEGIQRIVEKARFSDPAVTDRITGALVRRRELVLRSWLASRNPVSGVRLGRDGRLRFDNLAVGAGIAESPEGYELSWFLFDNESGTRRHVERQALGLDEAAAAPARLAGADHAGVDIRVRGGTADREPETVRIYFRADGDRWTTVAVERHVNPPAERYAQR